MGSKMWLVPWSVGLMLLLLPDLVFAACPPVQVQQPTTEASILMRSVIAITPGNAANGGGEGAMVSAPGLLWDNPSEPSLVFPPERTIEDETLDPKTGGE